ncbi:MAG: hypothetical protein C0467_26255 [Planctomycetaceae bacterium]|nr:hypothetical protein [Planctomycetaceae bacterium]
MDMAELSARTQLPVRKLRYVFDHGVLPGAQPDSPGQGIPRTFTDFEGFGIALAARLLDAGLTRKLVAACILKSGESPRRSARINEVPLYLVFAAAAGKLEVGDGKYLRLSGDARPGIAKAFDTGWQPLVGVVPAPDEYRPTVHVRFDLEPLVVQVRSSNTDWW